MTPRDDAPSGRVVDPLKVRLIADWPVALAALGLLAVMVAMSRDFGSTWDERALQKFGEQLWDYYTGRIPRSGIDISFGYMRIYGGLVEFLSVAAQHVIHADMWIVRHVVNATFGWVGVVFAFLMGARLFGRRAGWLSALLLVSMPRYIGESMNNPKDLPFAVLMFAACYYIVTIRPQYPYVTWRHAVKLAAAIALALNVRAMGLLALAYVGIAFLIAVVVSRDWSRAHLAGAAGRLIVIALLSLLGGCAFWPWAQERPLTRPIEAFFLSSTFDWGNPSLFMGRGIEGTAVPWYYLPTWLAITVPIVVLAGVGMSLLHFGRNSPSRWRLAGVWAFFLFPAAAAIVRHLSLYDGIRHMFFIVPPLAVIAAAGWDAVLSSKDARTRLIAAAALVGLIAEPLLFQIRNHPNQIVYFSPIIGGPRGAFGRYDMDYWGNCVLAATNWAASRADRAGIPVGVAANAWEVLTMDIHRYRSLYFRQQRQGGYHFEIILLKGSREGVTGVAQNPNIVHRVATADGTPLCVVLPGPEYPNLVHRLASFAASTEGQ